MNNRTAHIQFKVILDKNAQGVAFGGAPAFLPQEIDLFLNQGQDEIISNKISGNNVLKVGFEGSQQRISELDALVRTDKNVTANRREFNEFVLDNVHKDGERLTIWSVMLKYGNYPTNCYQQIIIQLDYLSRHIIILHGQNTQYLQQRIINC